MEDWQHEDAYLFNAQFLLYLSKPMKEDLRRLARLRGLSLSSFIRQTLADKLLADQVRLNRG